MPSEQQEPDWSRLPHDPAGFFGLSEPIDRRGLKRAYNGLLRQFKPEKAPAEFQRICAAYEALDERLRYGDRATPRHETRPSSWKDFSEAASTDPSPHEPAEPRPRRQVVDRTPIPRSKPKTLSERLETEAPAAIYQELSAQANKSPFDYYALAVLSDLVDRRKPLRFAEWLLSGIKAHPDDGALWRLLHEYIRGPLPPGAEVKLLPIIAGLSRGDFFYPLTEPLWLALLRAKREPR